ncbi:sigma-70 family RNA polymerase sigma factor [Streptomyces thermoalcalitolerans]|uniref:RNA polymerase sigma factor n=1 Tax=Streptomyces thermoalcalitolerans TaxID=65605 RepID=UPI0031E17D18
MTNEVCEAPEHDGDPNNHFAQIRPSLLAIARAAGDQDFTEDAVQITLEKIYKKYSTLEGWGPGRLKAYSRAVLKNVLRDEFRRVGRQRAIPTAPEDLPEQRSSLGLSEVAEVRAEIHRFVMGLPKRQREVVTLCLLKQMPRSEVAKKLGVHEDTVQKYMKAALRRLVKDITALSEEVTA